MNKNFIFIPEIFNLLLEKLFKNIIDRWDYIHT